jgi:uncharacterized protein (TIGR00369 family)
MTSGDSSTDFERLRVLFEEVIPFNRYLGIRVCKVEDGAARLELPFGAKLVGNPINGVLHGGVISTLLDNCGGLAVWTQIGPHDLVSTVDLRIDYLRPARSSDLVGFGRVVRLGNRVGVVELRAYNTDRMDDPVAAGTGVYNIRRSAATRDGNLWDRMLATHGSPEV